MRKKLTLLFVLIMCLPLIAASVPDDFEKFELVSTPERTVVGVDAKGLVVYGKDNEKITAYDIVADLPLFDLSENQHRVAPFNADGTAVITGTEGYTASIVSKNGTMLAVIPEGYKYSREFANGMVCLIDENVTENVYTLIDRKGNIIAEHFFAPECELENGNIIIANAGGGYSIINEEGKLSSFECRKEVKIEDAVSICTGVYVGVDGNVYSPEGNQLYKNESFTSISPINRSYALGTKKSENSTQHYIIDIKDKKDTIIADNGIFGDYIYSGGHVCDDKAFVGNSKKSVLVNLKNGKVLSAPVAGYSRFYDKVATVKTEQGTYRHIRADGTYFDGEYSYATDFKNGFSLAVEKEDDLTVISMVNHKGKKYSIHSLSAFISVEVSEKSAQILTETDGIFNRYDVEKTDNGNIYIGNMGGNSYVYAMKEKGMTPFKIALGVIAFGAVVFICFNAYFAVRRRMKK